MGDISEAESTRNLFAFSVEHDVHTIRAQDCDNEWYKKVQIKLIHSSHMYIKVDTGATCNVMPNMLMKNIVKMTDCTSSVVRYKPMGAIFLQ